MLHIFVGILSEFCRNFVGILSEFCRNFVGIFRNMLHIFRQNFLKTYSITTAHVLNFSNILQQPVAFFNKSSVHRVLKSNLV